MSRLTVPWHRAMWRVGHDFLFSPLSKRIETKNNNFVADCSFEKKFFQTSSPFSKLFYRSGKLLGKFQDFFFKEFKTLYIPFHPQYQDCLRKELRSYRKDMRDSQLGFCQDVVPLKRKCLCYNSCRTPVPFRFGKSLLKSIIAYRTVLVRVCKI